MNWKLYIHINKINGKKYIGITGEKNINRRWQNGRGYENQVFGKAIKKYGWDGFTHEVVAHGSEEEIKKMEEEFISKYKTQDRRFGYNIKSGGDGGKLTKGSKEKIRRKLRETNGNRVYRYEMDGELSRKYISYTEVEEDGFNINEVKKCCKDRDGVVYYKGHMWSTKKINKEEILKMKNEKGFHDKWKEEEDELCEERMRKVVSDYKDMCLNNGLVYRDIDCIDCEHYYYGIKSINCERCSNEFYP